MRNQLGAIAKGLRTHAGLSFSKAVETLRTTKEHLAAVEEGRDLPSDYLNQRYSDVFGATPYIMHVVIHNDPEKMPESMREPTRKLVEMWRQDLIELGLMVDT